MNFKKYVSLLIPINKKKLAKKLGISISYFNQIVRGTQLPSAKLAIKIEKVTGIKRKSLLPKIF